MSLGDNSSGLRSEDVTKFLEVFSHAENCPAQRRQSLRKLLEKKFDPLTTTLGQLQRVAEYFFGPTEQGGSGIERLFAYDKQYAGIGPTHSARVLERLLRIYDSFSSRLREQFREQIQQTPAARAVVRLGCPHTIGERLLASVLGNWNSALPNVDLHVTIENSRLLIPRLHAGLLDLVASYGPDDGIVPDTTFDVTFASLGYPSRMCLLCHPAGELWSRKTGKNLNAGYWNKSYSAESRPQRRAKRAKLDFSNLRSIGLDEIDFEKTNLIFVPSWRQPRLVEECVSRLQYSDRKIRTAESYDEALSLVRMKIGIAIATEVFSKRDHVTAFRLLPESSHTRWIGVYYNNRNGLSDQACQLAEFLREYRMKFEGEMRQGETPSFGDAEFAEWWAEVTQSPDWRSRDWKSYSKQRYPQIGEPFEV
jgi:DNA-binding transcriptional LysR family regulator